MAGMFAWGLLSVFCLVGAILAGSNGEALMYYVNLGGFFFGMFMAMFVGWARS